MNELEEPLVDRATGVVRVGRWAGPLDDPNIEDADIPHALTALSGWPGVGAIAEHYRRRYRLKIWQYMTFVTDGWFVAVAVADAGIAGNGFIYAVNTTTGEVRHKLTITPLVRGVQIARTSTRGGHS